MFSDQILDSRASILWIGGSAGDSHLVRLLRRAYRVRVVKRAAQAVKAASLAPPDLFLIDLGQPGEDGIELAKTLQANPYAREIPLIFLRPADDPQSRAEVLACGGVDLITRPYETGEVMARIQLRLAQHALQQKLRLANERLALQVDELTARNLELDAFAHTVAHDLKTPLSTIMLAAQLLVDTLPMLPQEQAIEDAKRIVWLSEKMDRTLEGLILLGGLRRKEVALQALDMNRVVADALTSLQYLIHQRQAEIILPESWPAVLGYPSWVEEIWVNYISNAIKYGGRQKEQIAPQIELGYDLPADELDAYCRFWVRDNGSGLTYEQQQRLFSPWERLDRVHLEGHGLGLSIVRTIAEKLGGRVGVESTPGSGSLFYFSLLKS